MKTIFLALLCGVILASCSDTVTAPETKYYSMKISIDHRFYAGQFQPGSNTSYINASGNALQFTGFKYLLSSFVLVKSDGTKLPLPNRYGFINVRDTILHFSLDSIPMGTYKGIEFIIGVDSTANHADPNKWPAEHPLNTSVNGLHWGWAGGYIFMAMDGNFFVQGGGNEGFSYHIGGDEHKMFYSIPIEEMRIAANSELKLKFNVDKLFAGPNVYDLSRDGLFSHSGNDGGIAQKFVENSQGAITYVSFISPE